MNFRFAKNLQAGVALDTNIFLLLIVGSINTDLLSKSSKTCKFDKADYETLIRFCSPFSRHVITPPIITEACNLLETLNKQNDSRVFQSIRCYLEEVKESRSESSYLASLPVFPTLGLADASLYALARQDVLILTDDLNLYGHIVSRKHAAMNFYHITVTH